MSLKLYRRHRKECEGGHPEDFKSGQFEEGRRGWKRCGCVIHAAGTLGEKFSRRQTGKYDWDEAKAVAAAWEAAESWTADQVDPINTSPQHVQISPKTAHIREAIKSFLGEREEIFAPNTYRKNRFVLNSLQAFADNKGYVVLDQWQPMDIRDLRSSWKVAQSTSAKYIEIVKAFFRFCHDNKWIHENPAKAIRPVKSKADRPNERVPFSDLELQQMYDACHNLYPKGRMYTTTGQDLADFIAVSVFTGLVRRVR
jgi:hypothetical protein